MNTRSWRIVAAAALLVYGLGIAHAQWTWTPQTRRWVNVKRMPKETPELQVQYARTLMLQGDYAKALRETEKFISFYGSSDYADDNQFLRGEIKLAQGKFMDASQEFQLVVTQYPDSELYDEVIEKQYEIGDGLYQKGVARQSRMWPLGKKKPFSKAIDIYSMVIQNEPFTDAAAQAQYKIGLCHYTLGQYMEAAYEYRRVIEEYPASEWNDEAAYGLAQCYTRSTLGPDYDQTPTQLAINAIDTFIERYPNDERVPELRENRDRLRENIARQRLQTARFYERRREFQAARISYEVVVQQYSDTDAANEAREWLASYEPGGEAAMGSAS